MGIFARVKSFFKTPSFTAVVSVIHKDRDPEETLKHFDTLEDARAFSDEQLSWPYDPVLITHVEIYCNKSGTRVHHEYS